MKLPLASLSGLTAFCDPAGRHKGRFELKRVRARTAIVVVGADDLGRIFVLDAWGKRATTEETVERLFTTNAEWHPRIFGIEANAMQELFAGMIALEARRSQIVFPMREVQPPHGVDKLWRIRTCLQPLLARGQLAIRSDLDELREEITSFPTGRTVDLVDALAYAIGLLPPRSVAAVPSGVGEGRQALQDYLTRAGVSPDLIAARLARYDREVAGRSALSRGAVSSA